MRQGRLVSDERRAHEILGDAGPRSAVVLVRSKDPETVPMVVSAAEVKRERLLGRLAACGEATDEVPCSRSCWSLWTPGPPTISSHRSRRTAKQRR